MHQTIGIIVSAETQEEALRTADRRMDSLVGTTIDYYEYINNAEPELVGSERAEQIIDSLLNETSDLITQIIDKGLKYLDQQEYYNAVKSLLNLCHALNTAPLQFYDIPVLNKKQFYEMLKEYENKKLWIVMYDIHV